MNKENALLDKLTMVVQPVEKDNEVIKSTVKNEVMRLFELGAF